MFKEPKPEQMTQQWLVQDDEHPHVLLAYGMEGDWFHIGWSVRMQGEDLTLPQVQAIGEAARVAIVRAIEEQLDA